MLERTLSDGENTRVEKIRYLTPDVKQKETIAEKVKISEVYKNILTFLRMLECCIKILKQEYENGKTIRKAF